MAGLVPTPELRLAPRRVVVCEAVGARGDDEAQLLRAADQHVYRPRVVVAGQDAAVVDLRAVGEDLEYDGAGAAVGVDDADGGGLDRARLR